MLDLHHRGRRGGERCIERHHLIAVGDLRPRVAAVERLGPEEPGVVQGLPLDRPRAVGHPLAGDVVGDRQVGDRGDRVGRSRPRPRSSGVKSEVRHAVRERSANRADQKVTSRRARARRAVIRAAGPMRSICAGLGVDARELARLPKCSNRSSSCALASRSWNVGIWADPAGALLHVGADRHPRRGRGRAAAIRHEHGEDVTVVAQPGDRIGQHVVEPGAGNRLERTAGRVGHPEATPSSRSRAKASFLPSCDQLGGRIDAPSGSASRCGGEPSSGCTVRPVYWTVRWVQPMCGLIRTPANRRAVRPAARSKGRAGSPPAPSPHATDRRSPVGGTGRRGSQRRRPAAAGRASARPPELPQARRRTSSSRRKYLMADRPRSK